MKKKKNSKKLKYSKKKKKSKQLKGGSKEKGLNLDDVFEILDREEEEAKVELHKTSWYYNFPWWEVVEGVKKIFIDEFYSNMNTLIFECIDKTVADVRVYFNSPIEGCVLWEKVWLLKSLASNGYHYGNIWKLFESNYTNAVITNKLKKNEKNDLFTHEEWEKMNENLILKTKFADPESLRYIFINKLTDILHYDHTLLDCYYSFLIKEKKEEELRVNPPNFTEFNEFIYPYRLNNEVTFNTYIDSKREPEPKPVTVPEPDSDGCDWDEMWSEKC